MLEIGGLFKPFFCCGIVAPQVYLAYLEHSIHMAHLGRTLEPHNRLLKVGTIKVIIAEEHTQLITPFLIAHVGRLKK